MILSEKAICELFSALLPSGRLNACFESDAEVIHFHGAPGLFTTDEFSAEDLFREDDPFLLGWNIAAGAISDIFACGGAPQLYAHALTVAEGWDAEYLGRFAAGVKQVLEATGARFIGGDCGRSAVWRCTVSVLGTCAGDPLLRRGASAGDLIYLSGEVGAGNLEAALRLAQRASPAPLRSAAPTQLGQPSPNPAEQPARSRLEPPAIDHSSHSSHSSQQQQARDLEPEARATGQPAPLRLPLRQRESALIKRHASAAIDTSDGVWAALNTLAEVNGCGYAVAALPYLPAGLGFCRAASLPKTLLFLGECGEYELLFTLRPEREEAFLNEARHAGAVFHRLGAVTPGPRTLKEDGQTLDLSAWRIQARDYQTPEQYLEALLLRLGQLGSARSNRATGS